MITQINFNDFVDAFKAIRPDNFTYEGLAGLFAHLEEWEEGAGEPVELDVIALCCDFTEYKTAKEAAKAAGLIFGDEDEAEDWLYNQTIIIKFDGGVIVADF